MSFGVLAVVVAAIVFVFTGPPTLVIDSQCRNDIRLDHVSGTWLNGGPIPIEWQFRDSVQGTFERLSTDEGIFRAEGFEVTMHEGNATPAVCSMWPDSITLLEER